MERTNCFGYENGACLALSAKECENCVFYKDTKLNELQNKETYSRASALGWPYTSAQRVYNRSLAPVAAKEAPMIVIPTEVVDCIASEIYRLEDCKAVEVKNADAYLEKVKIYDEKIFTLKNFLKQYGENQNGKVL